MIPNGDSRAAKQHKYGKAADIITNIPINAPAPIITTNKIITAMIPNIKQIGSRIMRIARIIFGF
jgi:hypothetical protein